LKLNVAKYNDKCEYDAKYNVSDEQTFGHVNATY